MLPSTTPNVGRSHVDARREPRQAAPPPANAARYFLLRLSTSRRQSIKPMRIYSAMADVAQLVGL
jgi:hypothetical protein